MFVCVGEKRKGKEKIVYGNYAELQIRSFTWLIDMGTSLKSGAREGETHYPFKVFLADETFIPAVNTKGFQKKAFIRMINCYFILVCRRTNSWKDWNRFQWIVG